MKKNIYSPGGNPTLLVENIDKSVPTAKYKQIAKDNLADVDQVGFIEWTKQDGYKLEMMWWEVCINGIRSMAYCDFETNGTQTWSYGCSGTTAQFDCEIETWVSIKIPKRFVTTDLFPWNFVRLDGIAYFVAEGRFEYERAKEELLELCDKYSDLIEGNPAIGLVLIEDEKKIWPLISVPAVNSINLETGCWTGTLAAYIAMKKKRKAYQQPSGSWYIIDDNEDDFVIKSIVERTDKAFTPNNNYANQ